MTLGRWNISATLQLYSSLMTGGETGSASHPDSSRALSCSLWGSVGAVDV